MQQKHIGYIVKSAVKYLQFPAPQIYQHLHSIMVYRNIYYKMTLLIYTVHNSYYPKVGMHVFSQQSDGDEKVSFQVPDTWSHFSKE